MMRLYGSLLRDAINLACKSLQVTLFEMRAGYGALSFAITSVVHAAIADVL